MAMWFPWKIVLDVLLVFLCNCAWTLRNVSIDIEPPVVERGETASLRCNYDLQGKPLYSVKWYRGSWEFYRYTPNEDPITKVFPFSGLQVNLQLSDEHQVVLENVDFNLSGNFTCEVSTDGPNFFTAMVSRNMSVVVLPKHPPVLSTERSHYEIGDTVRANCTSAPSKPAATLVLSLNNMVIPTKHEHQISAVGELWISHASVEFQLFPSHFKDGSVYLHCLAQVTNLYQHDTPLRLDNLKDPVPERVTSQSGGGRGYVSSVVMLWHLVVVLSCYKRFLETL